METLQGPIPLIASAEVAAVRPLRSGEESNLFVVTVDAKTAAKLAAGKRSAANGQRVFILKKQVLRSSQSVPRFFQEAQLIQGVASKSTKHLVLPLAFIAAPPDFAQVLPLAELGDLRAFSTRGDLTAAHILSLAVDMCAAVDELHSVAGLVHRDIKSANFLVFDEADRLYARLSDFGSARVANQEQDLVPDAHGPSRGFHKKRLRGITTVFAAPEVLAASADSAPSSTASDVYSLGIALAELATGLVPYSCSLKESPALNTVVDASYSEQALCQEIFHGLRPFDSDTARKRLSMRMGAELANDFAALLEKCWARSPAARPRASQVYREVLGIAAKHHVSLPCAALPPLDSVTGEADTKEGDAAGRGPGVIEGQIFYRPPLDVGVFASAGLRGADKMEDEHSITHATQEKASGAFSILCVFDGHGGAAAAKFAGADLAPRLHRVCREHEWGSEALRLAVEKCFEDCNGAFVESGDASGTTAVAVIVPTNASGKTTGELLVANAGDCRVVLGGRSGAARRLTEDHLASNAKERLRVEQAGGFVTADVSGKLRVQGLIQVTRSIGDAAVKAHGVVARPETCFVNFGGQEVFLIIASDGMWDTLTDEQAVRLVLDTAKEPSLSAKRLGSEALARGSTDNVTVLCAYLNDAVEG